MLAASIAATLALAPAATAGATTYRVHDGASLQAAVAAANASSTPSTIELGAGTYLPTSTLHISGALTITGPSAAPGARLDGGAVEPFPADLLVVDAHARVTLWNLEVSTGGGAAEGAAIDDNGALVIESSTLAGNEGPGLVVEPAASATVRNSTLSDGLNFGLVDLGTANLFNTSVAGNARGGVDDAGGTLNLTNTIVASNGTADCTRRATVSDHSLDGDGSCGVGALSRRDAMLGRLAANGGPTPTRALGAGSSAIGAGDDSKCPPEDQRHFLRETGRCDIGAYQTGAVSSGAPSSPSGAVPGGAHGRRARGRALVVLSAHGALRGARRTRITFSLRAISGQSHASFTYTDRQRGVVLRALTVSSLAIDAARGVATVRGRAVELPSGRRIVVALVLVSRAGSRSLRIRLSSGYFKSGGLIAGSIAFLRAARRSA